MTGYNPDFNVRLEEDKYEEARDLIDEIKEEFEDYVDIEGAWDSIEYEDDCIDCVWVAEETYSWLQISYRPENEGVEITIFFPEDFESETRWDINDILTGKS